MQNQNQKGKNTFNRSWLPPLGTILKILFVSKAVSIVHEYEREIYRPHAHKKLFCPVQEVVFFSFPTRFSSPFIHIADLSALYTTNPIVLSVPYPSTHKTRWTLDDSNSNSFSCHLCFSRFSLSLVFLDRIVSFRIKSIFISFFFPRLFSLEGNFTFCSLFCLFSSPLSSSNASSRSSSSHSRF